MPSGTDSSELRLLRPIRVIVVSRDERFASVFRFLLDRKHLAVRAARRQPELLPCVEQGVDVVVFDATQSLADAAERSRSSRPSIPRSASSSSRSAAAAPGASSDCCRSGGRRSS